eukprot:3821748-Pleurochrysis_carterae.AAC.2
MVANWPPATPVHQLAGHRTRPQPTAYGGRTASKHVICAGVVLHSTASRPCRPRPLPIPPSTPQSARSAAAERASPVKQHINQDIGGTHSPNELRCPLVGLIICVVARHHRVCHESGYRRPLTTW